jgi:hypothetical protein
MNPIAFNCLQEGGRRQSSDQLHLNYSQYSYRLQKQYLFEDFTVNSLCIVQSSKRIHFNLILNLIS